MNMASWSANPHSRVVNHRLKKSAPHTASSCAASKKRLPTPPSVVRLRGSRYLGKKERERRRGRGEEGDEEGEEEGEEERERRPGRGGQDEGYEEGEEENEEERDKE